MTEEGRTYLCPPAPDCWRQPAFDLQEPGPVRFLHRRVTPEGMMLYAHWLDTVGVYTYLMPLEAVLVVGACDGVAVY